jgi:hypothetical protein
VGALVAALCASTLAAQTQPPAPHDHPEPAPAGAQPAQSVQEDHSQHMAGAAMDLFPAREASGTSWLPDSSPMFGLHQQAGPWRVMWHGNAFIQYFDERGDRGSDQFGSINWIMGMARRELAGGRLGFRAMASLEPWTIPGCGYPDLLATGEVCEGETIHDRQHPHDLFMELAAEYERAAGPVRWQVYGGLAGEPALGPVAFPHRISAMPNALAPITHHWFDATHITFGVITGGVFTERWKAEASVFNGREPDEDRNDLDLAALDSLSGRFWYAPTRSLVLQASAGRLTEAEASHHEGDPRVDVDRITASATYHRSFGADGLWAATVGWGRNLEAGEATHALLVEAAITLRQRHAWFGRFEVAEKAAHDLDVPGPDAVFTLSKWQAGYTHYLNPVRALQPGIGAGVSLSVVPDTLRPVYGGRVNPGFGVFLTLRPAAHQM